MEVAVQAEPRGTGDAVAAARETLAGFDGRVLVLDAAAPLLTAEHLSALVAEHEAQGATATILSFVSDGSSRTAGSSARPTGRSARSSRSATRPRSRRRSASSTPSIYVFESGPALVGARAGSTRTTPRASTT